MKTGDSRGSVGNILGESRDGCSLPGLCRSMLAGLLIGNEELGITAVIKTTSTVIDAGRPNESRYRSLV